MGTKTRCESKLTNEEMAVKKESPNMGTKTAAFSALGRGSETASEKRIPKHGDEG